MGTLIDVGKKVDNEMYSILLIWISMTKSLKMTDIRFSLWLSGLCKVLFKYPSQL